MQNAQYAFFFNWSTLINIILATAINGLFFKESSKFQFKEYFFINISNFKFSRFFFNNCTLTDVNNHFLIKKEKKVYLKPILISRRINQNY